MDTAQTDTTARAKAEHGTWQCYASRKCRRADCRAAWATYCRERKHRLGLARSRDELRFYRPPYGRRGFDALTETILDAAETRTGRNWRDVVGLLVRKHGATVTFPDNRTH